MSEAVWEIKKYICFHLLTVFYLTQPSNKQITVKLGYNELGYNEHTGYNEQMVGIGHFEGIFPCL